MKELSIDLNANAGISLYEQIYTYIKREIHSQNLKKGDKLPSTRGLAKHLSVSRSTVIMAYDQLVSEGYIYGKLNSGYYVSDVNELFNITINKPVSVIEPKKSDRYQYDFSPGGVNLSEFPVNIWRRLTKNVLNDDNRELFNSGDGKGDYEFRESIAGYLHHSRGVKCLPEQIIIGAGNDYLLPIIIQLLGAKSIYAMEECSYIKASKIIRSLEKKVCEIPMDKEGMSVESLAKTPANIAYVMPSHQFPTGIVMPVKRRNELLRWASERDDRYIIEDDYDSEFRYRGKPIPSLQGQDTADKVIYIGTFSKAIAPAIRMSYAVLPQSLLKAYDGMIGFYSCSVSRIDQRIVNAFISEGHYERHLNRMRAAYKAKHDLIIELLKPFLAKFELSGDYSGTHILLTSKEKIEDRELVKIALASGVRVYPLSDFMLEPKGKSYTVIIGYASIEADMIEAGIELLSKSWLK